MLPEDVMWDVALKSPVMSNDSMGDVVPIPTFPLDLGMNKTGIPPELLYSCLNMFKPCKPSIPSWD